MIWHNKLYTGKKAKKNRYRMIQDIRNQTLRINAYVITPAINGNNILDIYPSMVLLQPYYKKKNLLVLGIAANYWEALQVAGEIVDDMYQKTGGFDLQAFLDRDEQ